MKKGLQACLAFVLVASSTAAWSDTVTYRLDGRYPGIASEWVEVDYSDVKPGHINKVAYWNTSEEKDALDIVEQKYVELDDDAMFTGKVRFPISGDPYQYAIHSGSFVLTDGNDEAVFTEEE